MNVTLPPLKVWYFVGGIFLLLLTSCIYFSYSLAQPKVDNEQKLLEESIKENNTTDSSKTAIVFLGSSLARCAFPDTKGLEEKIFNESNRKVSIFRMGFDGLNMAMVEDLKIFDFLKKYPPQYLFLESNRLNFEAGDENNKQFKQPLPMVIFTYDLGMWLKSKIGLGTYPVENPYVSNIQNYIVDKQTFGDIYYNNETNSAYFKTLLIAKRYVRRVAENKIANEAYGELIKKGTKIIFLDMPKAEALKNVYSQKYAKDIEPVLSFYKENYGIDCWTYPNILSDSCFFDGGHLKYIGSKAYQDWFVTQFRNEK